MKLRRLLAVLMLSVFCFSGCSNQLKEVSEMEKEIDQTTTTAATEETEIGEIVTQSDSEPDMSEKWKIVYGGGDAYNNVKYEVYSFTNESGYQFACTVYLPETAKKGISCPVLVMNNGSWVNYGTDEQSGLSAILGGESSHLSEQLLATALNEENMGLIVIEPFGSNMVYSSLLGAADINGESRADVPFAQGEDNNNSYTVDKGYMNVILDNLESISGVDPSRVVLASRGFHNISVTQSAIMNQDRIKGFLMIDPCMDYQSAIRSYSINPESDCTSYMAPGYASEIKDLNLKTEAGKLNVDNKVFFSKANENDYDSLAEEGAPTLLESAKNCYPNSTPETLDTTDFSWEYKPSKAKEHSVKKIVSYCDEIFKK